MYVYVDPKNVRDAKKKSMHIFGLPIPVERPGGDCPLGCKSPEKKQTNPLGM
jgi:hypothetical protein